MHSLQVRRPPVRDPVASVICTITRMGCSVCLELASVNRLAVEDIGLPVESWEEGLPPLEIGSKRFADSRQMMWFLERIHNIEQTT